MTEPKKACRKCYGHAINVAEATAVPLYLVTSTGTVHLPSDENAGETECGTAVTDKWDVYATESTVATFATPPTGTVTRRRNKVKPPSART